MNSYQAVNPANPGRAFVCDLANTKPIALLNIDGYEVAIYFCEEACDIIFSAKDICRIVGAMNPDFSYFQQNLLSRYIIEKGVPPNNEVFLTVPGLLFFLFRLDYVGDVQRIWSIRQFFCSPIWFDIDPQLNTFGQINIGGWWLSYEVDPFDLCPYFAYNQLASAIIGSGAIQSYLENTPSYLRRPGQLLQSKEDGVLLSVIGHMAHSNHAWKSEAALRLRGAFQQRVRAGVLGLLSESSFEGDLAKNLEYFRSRITLNAEQTKSPPSTGSKNLYSDSPLSAMEANMHNHEGFFQLLNTPNLDQTDLCIQQENGLGMELREQREAFLLRTRRIAGESERSYLRRMRQEARQSYQSMHIQNERLEHQEILFQAFDTIRNIMQTFSIPADAVRALHASKPRKHTNTLHSS